MARFQVISRQQNVILLSSYTQIFGLTSNYGKRKAELLKTYDFTKGGTSIIHQRINVQIWSFFWFLFSCARVDYGPEKTPYLYTFHALKEIDTVDFLFQI